MSFVINLLILLVSKIIKSLLLFLIFSFNLIPICNSLSETFVPIEISVIDLEYPPKVKIFSSSIGYSFNLTYNIKNPNNETVVIFMPSCYPKLPFAHINATFAEENVQLFYGYGFYGISCSESYGAGLNVTRDYRFGFTIYNHTEERLPIGTYTIWLDLNYTHVYCPTVVSYAYMNVSVDSVEIEYDWGSKSETYSEIEFEIIYFIFPLVIISFTVYLKRKRSYKTD